MNTFYDWFFRIFAVCPPSEKEAVGFLSFFYFALSKENVC